MSLKDDLKKLLVEATKARDQVKVDTLRAIQSSIRYKEIDKRGDLTDGEAISVVSTLCKQRRESIEQFEKGGRADLVDKEKRELQILEVFLPQQLSRPEVEAKIRKIIGDVGANKPSDMGRVMKLAMQEMGAQADGKLVNEIVRSLLPL